MSDRLREALDAMPDVVSDDADVVIAAARRFLALCETGQRVEWCPVHEAPEAASEEPGVCWLYDGGDPCRIVPVLVIPADYLTEET